MSDVEEAGNSGCERFRADNACLYGVSPTLRTARPWRCPARERDIKLIDNCQGDVQRVFCGWRMRISFPRWSFHPMAARSPRQAGTGRSDLDIAFVRGADFQAAERNASL